MKKSDLLFIFSSFVIWRVALFVFLFIAIKYVPLQKNFLGGGMQNYLSNPWFWSWINFDGEHYLSIAQMGYQPLTYFFFPIFPVVSRFIGNLIGGGFFNLALAGLVVSNVSFFVALIGLWKLAKMEFDKTIANYTVLLLLLFPTSYYFGSYYTESIFLAVIVWSFYMIRKDKWMYAGTLGGISTAIRIIGVALLPSFAIEMWQRKRKNFLMFLGTILVPLGILIYMYYLNIKTGDPLNFLNTISIFGAQRSSTFIILPQVFYRYIFKIIPALNFQYFPSFFTTFLEIFSALSFLFLSILSFWKTRLSYAVYLSLGYIIPTMSGSFSSLPRYVLILFPAFILSAVYVRKLSRIWRALVFSILSVCLAVATMMFTRGYWVS